MATTGQQKPQEAIRRRALAVPRRRVAGRFPVLQQPDLQRAAYFRELDKLVSRAASLLDKHLVPVLEQLDAAQRDDAVRLDAPGEVSLRNLFRKVAREFLGQVPNSEMARLAEQAAQGVSSFQLAQMRAAWRSALGIDIYKVFRSEPRLRTAVKRFTTENVALIKSIPSTYFSQVEKVVFEGVRKGTRHETLRKLIEQRTGVARSRAALIARDQVGKFYGDLHRERQQALGVSRYRWRTMRDNLVREEHEAREGQTFTWDNPPEDGHPGHPINCRCWAEPDIEELLASGPLLNAAVESSGQQGLPLRGRRVDTRRLAGARVPLRPATHLVAA